MKDKTMYCGILPLLAFCGCENDKVDDYFGARPNILIAIADDMSYPHAGAYGCGWVNTPGFDRVADEGLLFNNCYTPNAKSAPSRACILTGRYSWQLEEAANHIGFWPVDKYPTFMEVLAASGYHAGFTGKGWAPGDPGYKNGKPRRLTGEPYQDRKTVPPTSKMGKTDYFGNFKDFIDDVGESPWIFWYGSTEPHRDYEFNSGIRKGGKSPDMIDKIPAYWPDDDTTRIDMLDYAYEIEYFDSHLLRMIEELDRRGELENTLIIVTADNGMPFPRCKGLGYHDSVHLPLAMMWKNGIRRNADGDVDTYISFIDLAPTILYLAGIDPIENGMAPTGKEMTDIFSGKENKGRSYILLGQERHDYGRPKNQGYPIRSIIKDGYLYLHNFKPELWPAGNPETGYLNCDGSPVKTSILKLRREKKDTALWHLAFGKHPQEELYDLKKDPECLDNLASKDEYEAVKESMKRILFEDLEEQQDPRVTGNGDVFDNYPFYQQNCFWYYERYMSGDVKTYQTDWVSPTDYEIIDK